MPMRPGFHTITPYLSIRDSVAALVFFEKAFGAETTYRHADSNGVIRHAELRIGDSHLMLHEEVPEFKSVQAMGGSPLNLFLYVDDVDAFIARAVAAGATEIGTIKDQPHGRSGGVYDPFGLSWWVTTHKDPAPS